MTSKLQTLIKKTNSTRELMKELVDSGITSVNEALQGTKLFSSLIASNARELEFDETHYLLIPLPESPANYAIFTKRVLPPGIGNLNNLPKARIFHVPEPDGKPILEEELIKHYMTPLLDSDASSPDFATTLEDLAALIDSETSRISGGLIIIVGVVAFLNPLLGVGFASNALLPAVGAKATKAGADYVGQNLRRFQRESTENKARKSAQKEVKKLKPQIFNLNKNSSYLANCQSSEKYAECPVLYA